MFPVCNIRLTVDLQVSRDGDVAVFDGAAVLSAVLVTDVGHNDGTVGEQGDTRVRQQRKPVVPLPAEHTHLLILT